MPGVPADCFKSVAVGQQAVSKGRQGTQALNKVQASGWRGSLNVCGNQVAMAMARRCW